jgi:hypothetical protein
VLPGRGLAEHDFFYAGEAKDRRMYIVRQGKIVWEYDDPKGQGEISDAILYSDDKVLLAHQFAIKLIDGEKRVLWNLQAPQGTEIHTAQLIGKDHVIYIQNGEPALLKVVNIRTEKTVKEFKLRAKNPKGIHGMFRHARLTPEGTVLVAHKDMGKVIEYDADGKELWSWDATVSVWGVEPLKNGNVLVTDRNGVHEINRKTGLVWEVTPADLPEYKLSNLQLAWRLPNGNTLFNDWFNQWEGTVDVNNAPVQAIEVTPDKKVVWALRAWGDPVNLGPATTIQLLDEPVSAENVRFGDIK